MEIVLIGVLILINGVFSMSEMAVSVSRKAKLAALASDGDKAAQKALDMMENPNNFLSTVQIGITSIGILNGIFGEAAFSQSLAFWLLGFGVDIEVAEVAATVVVVFGITFTSIVFGEIVPKRIGLLFPERIASAVAGPMQGLTTITRPFVYLLSGSTQAVMALLRLNKIQPPTVTEEEINASLDEGVVSGLIELHEQRMVHNVFYLDDRPLSSMMRLRSEVEWLDAGLGVKEALAVVAESGHSYYPVCLGDLDHVLGVVGVQELLRQKDSTQKVQQLREQAIFVPETLSGMELIEQFRTQSLRMVMVVDEYGIVQGLLTPFDLLEAIAGELHTSEQEEAWAVQGPKGVWRLAGTMPVSELRVRLEIKSLPNEDSGQYNTLAGLLMAQSGRILQKGDIVTVASWRFRVEEMEKFRISVVSARPEHVSTET